MKKTVLFVSCITLVITISSCMPLQSSYQQETSGNSAQTEKNTKLDLTGEWEQINSNDSSTIHTATITDNEIEIYWFDSQDETKSLYWAGTYVPPKDSGNKYEWDSINNTEKTSGAMLASSDETKHFTYENGQISYEASAFGTTKIIRLEKKK